MSDNSNVQHWKKIGRFGTSRLLASLIDVGISSMIGSIVAIIVLRVLRISPSVESEKELLYSVFIPLITIYFLFWTSYIAYQCSTYLLFGTTIGKHFFDMRYVNRGGKERFSDFLFRLILIVLFFGGFGLIGLFIIPTIYYLLKIYDPYTDPFWDVDVEPSLAEGSTSHLIKIKYIAGSGTVLVTSILIWMVISPFVQKLIDPAKEVAKEFYSVVFSDIFSTWSGMTVEVLELYYQEGDYSYVINKVEESDDLDSLDLKVLNLYGLALISNDEPEKAVQVYTDILSRRRSELTVALEDSINNNLGWAYNETGEYESAIKTLEFALTLDDNSHYEFSNLANAYYMMDNNTEAAKYYEEAILTDGHQDYVYYNLGICYYDLQQYELAKENFETYLELDPDDVDTFSYIGWCIAFGEDNYESGLTYFQHAIEVSESDSYAVFSILDYMNYFEHYEEALSYEETLDTGYFVDDEYVTEETLKTYEGLGLFEEGLVFAEKYVPKDAENTTLFYQKLDFYYNTKKNQEAKYWLDHLGFESDYDSQMLLADLYQYNYYFLDAAKIYEQLIQDNDGYSLEAEQREEAIYRLIQMYYNSDYYDEVINLCRIYEKSIQNYNIYGLWGNSFFEIGNLEAAAVQFDKAVAFDGSETSYVDRLNLEIYQGKLDNALQDLEQAYEKGLSESEYEYHLSFIEDQMKLKPGEQIFDFLKENYMYQDVLNSPDIKLLERELTAKETLTEEDYYRINNQIFRDDEFSYILYDQWFEDAQEQEQVETISSRSYSESVAYIKIDFFNMWTDTEFLRVLKNIRDSNNKTLVIDLRSNPGGDTSSAYNILDYLIGPCFLGSWDAHNDMDYDYYSDGNLKEFKQICVLVDDESASSAEIVALGIKEYVPKSLIIGETTFGKGVGQSGLVNLKEGFALYAVNAYWTIGDKNIHTIGVEPDIELNDGALDAYMAQVVLGR